MDFSKYILLFHDKVAVYLICPLLQPFKIIGRVLKFWEW